MKLSCYISFGKKSFKIEKDGPSIRFNFGFGSFCIGFFNIEDIVKNMLCIVDNKEKLIYKETLKDKVKIKELEKESEIIRKILKENTVNINALKEVETLKKVLDNIAEKKNKLDKDIVDLEDEVIDLESEIENLKKSNKDLIEDINFWKDCYNDGYGL